jgi:hypothetical protein
MGRGIVGLSQDLAARVEEPTGRGLFLGFGAKNAGKDGGKRLKRFGLRYSRNIPYEETPHLSHCYRYHLFAGGL